MPDFGNDSKSEREMQREHEKSKVGNGDNPINLRHFITFILKVIAFLSIGLLIISYCYR